jgi:putative transposase
MKPTNLSKASLRKADGVAADQQVYFHIYNRGVNGQEIFTSEDNYSFLLRRMQEFSKQLNIAVIAYCLMPNHFHVLVEAENRKQASRFIQKLFNSYSQAFNRQQGRTGTLFQGRAKFKVIDSDEYAIEICSYIHLNPVKAGLVNQPGEWKYSNYAEWVNQETKSDPVLRFFDGAKEYEQFVLSNLAKD